MSKAPWPSGAVIQDASGSQPGPVRAEAKRLSIILPVYNVSEFLQQCLDSIKSQDFGQVEVIAVDDGSTDASSAILAKNLETWTALRVVRQENQGLSSARNTGLSLASGQYVWFVDSDDVVESGALERITSCLEGDASDVLVFNATRFGGDQVEKPIFPGHIGSTRTAGIDWLRFSQMNGGVRHFTFLHVYRRDFLLDNSFRFDVGVVHEDILWTMDAALKARSIRFENAFVYRYRRNPASITGGKSDQQLMRRIQSYFHIVGGLCARKGQYSIPSHEWKLLADEALAQAMQINGLRSRLRDESLKLSISRRCADMGLWLGLARDARLRQRLKLYRLWLRDMLATR